MKKFNKNLKVKMSFLLMLKIKCKAKLRIELKFAESKSAVITTTLFGHGGNKYCLKTRFLHYDEVLFWHFIRVIFQTFAT